MAHKVQWKLTVEEYEIHNSPESWTSALPGPSTASPKLPPPPRPNQNLPLQGGLELHPALTPAQALQLDFSFPSAAFRANPQLTQTLLDAPACQPKQGVLHLSIGAGRYTAELDIVHNPPGRTVTVGDVLGAIQNHLRQYDRGAPREAAPYTQRRIETVNGYCPTLDARTKAGQIAAEAQGRGRFVDRLLGHTRFAGLTPRLGGPDNCWEVELVIPERYAY
ncbi:hypothetical protein K438DRAFT_1973448 [Mycena galopus ATCC 62051]|nr:hypothetical protein K438DRAFT_1973448 [Mycena galopus ATCC 62051]